MSDRTIFDQLKESLQGELLVDDLSRKMYATDASAYREIPSAVALPKTNSDIELLISFATANHTSIIPRTAGTSLAGQVVGAGIVVDVSKHLNQILEINTEEKWVRVQPGVIRDELNQYLEPYGFIFGPETSTANRAMIGGMIGNNSCGSNSIVFGSTRDHLKSATVLLSDGNEVVFEDLSITEFDDKCLLNSLEGNLYRNAKALFSDESNRAEIENQFPKKSIDRRNTGYAIDLLKDTEPFLSGGKPFNFCQLLAGSEGTLGFVTEAKLSISPLPPKYKALVCGHYESVNDSLLANLIALKYAPSASELMDHYILDCTKDNLAQSKNRFFVQGDPKAVLVVELSADSQEKLEKKCQSFIAELQQNKLGYHYPIIQGEDIKKVWELRKAGLGL